MTLLQGHCLDRMAALPDGCIQSCITSPPYYLMRDYKIPPTVWGGDPQCDHDWDAGASRGQVNRGFCRKCSAWRGCFGLEPTIDLYLEHTVLIFRSVRRLLRDDGTLWLNLGDSFAGRNCGGDTGASTLQGSTEGQEESKVAKGSARVSRATDIDPGSARVSRATDSGIKTGDLCGIPWRVAFALQEDGWFLRRDNIWFKPNPMPESVNGWRWEQHRIKIGNAKANPKKPSGWDGSDSDHHELDGNYNENQFEAEFKDCPGCVKCHAHDGMILRRGNWRCTSAHEYVFQFSKSKNYFCNAEEAREMATGNAHPRSAAAQAFPGEALRDGDQGRRRVPGVHAKAKVAGKNSRAFVERDPAHCDRPINETEGRVPGVKQSPSYSAAVTQVVSSRNRRSVWPIATAPYREAHFATFPPALVRPIILAATPASCCGRCGAPFAPVVQRGEPDLAHQQACGGDEHGEYFGTATKDFAAAGVQNASAVKARILAGMVRKDVTGHKPSCRCKNAPPTHSIVLDPFCGSGTVPEVALENGRAAIGIDINAQYIALAFDRTDITPGLPGL